MALRYDVSTGRAHFDIRFDEPVELAGHFKLRLWVQADGAADVDLFVGLDELDTEGAPLPFTYFALYDDGPLALGWLRASHRALDKDGSTPWQPWHKHDKEEFCWRQASLSR